MKKKQKAGRTVQPAAGKTEADPKPVSVDAPAPDRDPGGSADEPAPEAAPAGDRIATVLAVVVPVIVAIAYLPVLRNGFLNYDDDLLVTDNPMVNPGLTIEGIKWAFTQTHRSNWLPVSWLSHMVDCSLFALNAWGHHLTSLVLHIANTILLFGFIRRISGSLWTGAIAAALFGVHPIHVESVAWVAERKDVLSAFFWLLTCHAYLRYVNDRDIRSYFLAMVLLGVGLMAKPMLVTLPFVLLLLDFWPLRRMAFGPSLRVTRAESGGLFANVAQASFGRLILEKLPFFGLAVAACVITFLAQKGGGAVEKIAHTPIGMRMANALYSYLIYLLKMAVPHGLSVFVPHPRDAMPAMVVIGAAVLLIGVTAAVLYFARRCPFLPVGWFWYLGTLVPVIGIIQVGAQGHAYRYTYIPMIGIYIMLTLGLPPLFRRFRLGPPLLAAAAATAVLVLAATTWCHTGYWRNNETLYTYALSVTEDNYLAHSNLAAHLMGEERHAEAIPHAQAALRIRAAYASAQRNLGLCYLHTERYDEAIGELTKALIIHPRKADIHYNLAIALTRTGRSVEAAQHYALVLDDRPDDIVVLMAAAALYSENKETDKTIECLERVLVLEPTNDTARFFIGYAHYQAGSLDDALEALTPKLRLSDERRLNRFSMLGSIHTKRQEYEQAASVLAAGLKKFPNSTDLLDRLAHVEYTNLKYFAAAHEHFVKLLELRPDHPSRENYATILAFLGQRLNRTADPNVEGSGRRESTNYDGAATPPNGNAEGPASRANDGTEGSGSR